MASHFQQFADEHPFLCAMLLGCLFVSVWIVINFLISRKGWHAFACRYPVGSRPAGAVWGSPFTSFGGLVGSHYTYCVQVIFCEAGVYFFTSLLTRAFHSPFMVPWASVKRIEKKTGLLPRYLIDIGDAAGQIHVTLPEKAEPELLKYKQAA